MMKVYLFKKFYLFLYNDWCTHLQKQKEAELLLLLFGIQKFLNGSQPIQCLMGNLASQPD